MPITNMLNIQNKQEYEEVESLKGTYTLRFSHVDNYNNSYYHISDKTFDSIKNTLGDEYPFLKNSCLHSFRDSKLLKVKYAKKDMQIKTSFEARLTFQVYSIKDDDYISCRFA